jgi:uncharacterized protein
VTDQPSLQLADAVASAAVPLIARGVVRHARHRPAEHAFVYPTWFVLLPMRAMRAQSATALKRNQPALVSFADRDHGDGGPDALAWLERLLEREAVAGCDGEIWLQTYPRVAGFAFKPVSFWYCHGADGRLRAVVVEVNNTFGERHIYLLDGDAVNFGATLTASKVFHVSPFCDVQGHYRFRFGRTADRVIARVELAESQGPLITTSVSGELTPLTPRSLRAVFWSMPLLTWGVMARIHWQALALWRKRVPFFHKPPPPATWVSR